MPANRVAHKDHGGPFGAPQLKVIQEAISLTVFSVFSIYVLKERLRTTDFVALFFIFLGVLIGVLGKIYAPDDPNSAGLVVPPPPPPSGWETVGLLSALGGYLSSSNPNLAAMTPPPPSKKLSRFFHLHAQPMPSRKALKASPLPHFLDSGAIPVRSQRGETWIELSEMFAQKNAATPAPSLSLNNRPGTQEAEGGADPGDEASAAATQDPPDQLQEGPGRLPAILSVDMDPEAQEAVAGPDLDDGIQPRKLEFT